MDTDGTVRQAARAGALSFTRIDRARETPALRRRSHKNSSTHMIRDSADKPDGWDVTHSYDRSAERPSEVVVRAVAGTTNQRLCSIDPLYDSIEPDALNAFIGEDDSDAAAWITFFHEGCRVYVDGDSVSVARTDEAAAVDRR